MHRPMWQGGVGVGCNPPFGQKICCSGAKMPQTPSWKLFCMLMFSCFLLVEAYLKQGGVRIEI